MIVNRSPRVTSVFCLLFSVLWAVVTIYGPTFVDSQSQQDFSSETTFLPLFSTQKQASSPGIFVLGMHRSGTSTLAGLLEAHGYSTLGYTKEGSIFNEKGYFELATLVAQNEIWLEEQHCSNISVPVGCFNVSLSSPPSKTGLETIRATQRPTARPWLLKDPRLCATLPAWIQYMNFSNTQHPPPAVVFIYRHPLDVGKSIKRRQHLRLPYGLQSWIFHNRHAVENSNTLCRVVTEYETLLKDPLKEILRISKELTHRCRVVPPRGALTQAMVDQFVDPRLRHHQAADESPGPDTKTSATNTSFCTFREHALLYNPNAKRYYRPASQIFCDLKSGAALQGNYEWPTID